MRYSPFVILATTFSFASAAQAAVAVNAKSSYSFDMTGPEAQTFYQELSKVLAGGVNPGASINFGRLECNEGGFESRPASCSVEISPTSTAPLNHTVIAPLVGELENAYFKVHGESSVIGVVRGSCQVNAGATLCTFVFQANGGAA